MFRKVLGGLEDHWQWCAALTWPMSRARLHRCNPGTQGCCCHSYILSSTTTEPLPDTKCRVRSPSPCRSKLAFQPKEQKLAAISLPSPGLAWVHLAAASWSTSDSQLQRNLPNVFVFFPAPAIRKSYVNGNIKWPDSIQRSKSMRKQCMWGLSVEITDDRQRLTILNH